MEEPTEEKAEEAAEFFKAVYHGLFEEEAAEGSEKEDSEESAEETEEKSVCHGKYLVKETASGISFRLAAGNSQEYAQKCQKCHFHIFIV